MMILNFQKMLLDATPAVSSLSYEKAGRANGFGPDVQGLPSSQLLERDFKTQVEQKSSGLCHSLMYTNSAASLV